MIHINKFLDKIKTSESKQLKTVSLSIKEARDVHADITKLLMALYELQKSPNKEKPDNVTKVEITGGEW